MWTQYSSCQLISVPTIVVTSLSLIVTALMFSNVCTYDTLTVPLEYFIITYILYVNGLLLFLFCPLITTLTLITCSFMYYWTSHNVYKFMTITKHAIRFNSIVVFAQMINCCSMLVILSLCIGPCHQDCHLIYNCYEEVSKLVSNGSSLCEYVYVNICTFSSQFMCL